MKKNNNIPHFNTDAAWQKLDARIQERSRAVRPLKTIPSLYKRIAAAAAIIALAIGGWLIWETNLQWQTIAATEGNRSFQLPDGSSVLLRKGSVIRYRQPFSSEERAVSLAGEAFFEIKRNEKQPFRVATANADIRVLGTSFLVRSQKRTDEIVVVTGKVSVTGKQQSTGKVLLAAGQRLVLNEEKLSESTVSDSNYVAWTTGVLDFKDAPLAKVLADIERYYETPIAIADDAKAATENIRVTARFQDQALEQVLEEIRLITGLETKKDQDKIVFYKK